MNNNQKSKLEQVMSAYTPETGIFGGWGRPSAMRRWGLLSSWWKTARQPVRVPWSRDHQGPQCCLWCAVQRNPHTAPQGHGCNVTVQSHGGRPWECSLLEECMSKRLDSPPEYRWQLEAKMRSADGSMNGSHKRH